jgi:hypothetical protein
VQVCRWLEEEGVDAIHVSAGSFFPHPKNPKGIDLPVEDLAATYDTMISSGSRGLRNYLLFRTLSGKLARRRWNRAAGPSDDIEGHQPARGKPDQGGRGHPGHLHGRVPDGLAHPPGTHQWSMRRGQHRPAAHRQQRPRAAVRGGAWTRRPGPAPTATSAS